MRLTAGGEAKLACWIDLLVPYCGDYREANAWSQEDLDRVRPRRGYGKKDAGDGRGEHPGVDRAPKRRPILVHRKMKGRADRNMG